MSRASLSISDSSPAGALKKGIIQLPIGSALIIGSNDIANTAHVSKNTDPILERENGATDKALRLSWASASVLEVQLASVTVPPDLDASQPMYVKVLARMKAASVDVPVITVAVFIGVGGANAGGNTAALSTSLQTLSVTIAAANVGPYPTAMAISLKPGTHATSANDVYVSGAWLEYTRKA